MEQRPRIIIQNFRQEQTAARTREYKRKAPESIVPFEQYLSHEQFFINYVKDHVKQPYSQRFLDIALRLKRIFVSQETYFESTYWTNNDGKDLRKLAHDLTQLTDSKRQYAALIQDPIFIDFFTKYLADRYPGTTDQLRAAIPFGSWSGATQWIQQILARKHNFEKQWCQEVSILQRWIDAAKEAGDPFYRDGILFLIRALPDSDPLITRPNSCIQDLRVYVGDRHPEITEALANKGVE